MDHVKKTPMRTHAQITVSERRKLPRGRTELVNVYRVKRPKYKFNVPGWMLPKNGVHIFSTLTASIVWGICGRMADVPEYDS